MRLILALLAALHLAMPAAALDHVWLEGEAASEGTLAHKTENPKPDLLSGEGWLVGEGAGEIRYRFDAPSVGAYRLWLRVGYEWERSPLSWRIDNGAWSDLGLDVLTTNVKRIGTWAEVAWWRAATVRLGRGAHTLVLKYPGRQGKKRNLVALDAIALVAGEWSPEGRLKPGARYDSKKDRAAAAHRFALAEPRDASSRSSVTLSGPWQVARFDDPDMDAGTYELPSRLPEGEALRWMAVDVPSNLWDLPEIAFGHRVVYRTRVRVPASCRGRSFHLHFSGTNWLVGVFVNGAPAGTHRGVFVPWDLDITPHVKPGALNELAIVIKGPWYAIDFEAMHKKSLDETRNLPTTQNTLKHARWIAPIWPSSKGDGNGTHYGLVNPVTLTASGQCYSEDVFVKTYVSDGKLEAEVTLRNTSSRAASASVRCEAVDDRTGEVARTFGPVSVDVNPGRTTTCAVGGAWADAKLWWPKPDPDLYRLRTVVARDGVDVDTREDLFGFREVSIEKTWIEINGVRRNLWCWVHVAENRWSAESFLDGWRHNNDRFIRMSLDHDPLVQLPREERLEFCDRHGIPGRLSSMIDGMFINYNLKNPAVWEGFRRHMDQLTRAYRNHPSSIMYQVENELMYINAQNVFGYMLDELEQRMAEVVEAGRRNDSTRPFSLSGGGDLSGRMEINCPHYPEGKSEWYPDNAYTLSHIAGHSARWPNRFDRPWLVGESYLRGGSYVGGDRTFRGGADRDRSYAKMFRMLYGGYRWAGVAGFFPWTRLSAYEDGQKAFSDLAVVTRKQEYRFASGRTGFVHVKVLNDTWSSAPISFDWEYTVGGTPVAGETQRMEIAPGFGRELHLMVEAPRVDRRADGTLTMRVSQAGARTFEDRKLIPVLPRAATLDVDGPVHVYDRPGTTAAYLAARGVAFQRIGALRDVRSLRGVLIVGHDTLTADEAIADDLMAFAVAGGRAIVLEQDNCLAGSALPAPMRSSSHFGGYSFPQASSSRVFEDLAADDFTDWLGDHPTYRNAYLKPLSGARSLVECGEGLWHSALLEVPCGRGVIVLCQLRVGGKLGLEPAADVLFGNLVEAFGRYVPSSGIVAHLIDDPLKAAMLERSGIAAQKVGSVDDGLDAARFGVFVVEATAANLARLAGNVDRVDAFAAGGGNVMLWGLEPDGLSAFNDLTGRTHQIRPFRIERVVLDAPDHPLAATLGNRDFSMHSDRRMTHGNFLSGDVLSWVVDAGRDAAPFCRMPKGPEDPFVYEPTYNDHDPFNYVNGVTNAEEWRYIRQIWVNKGGVDAIEFGLRAPETIGQVDIWNNENYWTIEKLRIVFDGRDDSAVTVTLPDAGDNTEVVLDAPVRVERTIGLQILTWRERQIANPNLRLVGIDNVRFLRARKPEGCAPLDSCGGIVAYPRGKGAIVLNQLKPVTDESGGNRSKKDRIMLVLLQNLGAGSRVQSVAVPGVNVRFHPVNITKYCTQYRETHGGEARWFGTGVTLRGFGKGEKRLDEVLYHVVDYATAPVPDCIVLGSDGGPAEMTKRLPRSVKGIVVDRAADALFFLHAAHVNEPVRDWERRKMTARRNRFVLPTLMTYVVNYADGSSVEVPVVLEKHVDHWRQAEPRGLIGAAVAWTGPVEGSDERRTLYGMKWSNPRPEIPIATIDVKAAGKARRASCAVLAITAGTVRK